MRARPHRQPVKTLPVAWAETDWAPRITRRPAKRAPADAPLPGLPGPDGGWSCAHNYDLQPERDSAGFLQLRFNWIHSFKPKSSRGKRI